MDKSWIGMPRNTLEYMEGLDKFLDFAFANRSVEGCIICPCKKCKFGKWKSREVVYEHLIVNPFPKGYTVWLRHGETRSVDNTIETPLMPSKIEDTILVNDPMHDMVNDAFRHHPDNDIEGKFDIHSDLQKSYVFKSLGLRWRKHRQDLWHARDDNTRTRDELIAMVPEGVNRDHWTTFVDYRPSEKTKLNAQKNKENRKKQTIHHTTGSKSLARKRAEMEKDFGRKVSRGEVWTVTHKRPDGTFVNDQAKEISVKIQEYENTVSLSQEISTQDSLAHALGSKEHCGSVRGLGLGPCPSQVFGHPSHYYSGMTSSSPSYTLLQNQVITLQSQVDEQNKKYDEQNKKFDALMSFLTHNFPGQLPLDLTMFQTTPVSDEGSAHPTNPTNDATRSPTNLEPEE